MLLGGWSEGDWDGGGGGGHAAGTGEKRNAYGVLIKTPESKRLLGKQAIDCRFILKWNWNRVLIDWICVAQDTDQWRVLVDTLSNHRIAWNVGNCLIIRGSISFVGRDSSVGIGTRYRLDGHGIESRWGREISASFHAGSGADAVSSAVDTGSVFWEWNDGGVALTTNTHLVSRLKKE
jgi:hypothetical protein